MKSKPKEQESILAPAQSITFPDLLLAPAVEKAVTALGYEIPTPIQAQVIPQLLQGNDLLGVAQTGTGKTAAFALPLLSNIDVKAKKPQVLCLTPTRELAIQVAEAFQSYAHNIKYFKVLPVYGGAAYGSQIKQLGRGVQVVVGTPGRVMDHIRRSTLKLDELQTLVLDEADEMLRMGFIDDVEWILEHTPKEHQTALFSATMPAPIKRISRKYLNEPVEITIKQKTTTAAKIRQRFISIRSNEKLDTLTRVLEVEEFDGVIIFVRTKNSTTDVAERLQARGHAVAALNGDIAQSQREKTVNRLKKGQLDILVATDVAARGLDVERVSHVINFDVPYDTESYVHRIGRTGRAGRDGDAILFVKGREKRLLQAIENATRQKISPFEFPSVDVLNGKKFEQLFERIDKELEKELAEYQSVIKKYMVYNEIDPLKLAAAIASLEGDSRPFYIKEQQQPRRDRKEKKDYGRIDKNSKKWKRRSSSKEDRKRSQKKFDASFETYRLKVGEVHRVTAKDIVGAIVNEANMDSREMGKIEICDDHSYVELPSNLPKELLKTIGRVWVRGQKLGISKISSKNIDLDADEGGRGEQMLGLRKSSRGDGKKKKPETGKARSGKAGKNRSKAQVEKGKKRGKVKKSKAK